MITPEEEEDVTLEIVDGAEFGNPLQSYSLYNDLYEVYLNTADGYSPPFCSSTEQNFRIVTQDDASVYIYSINEGKYLQKDADGPGVTASTSISVESGAINLRASWTVERGELSGQEFYCIRNNDNS